jgi:hypothetical protein
MTTGERQKCNEPRVWGLVVSEERWLPLGSWKIQREFFCSEVISESQICKKLWQLDLFLVPLAQGYRPAVGGRNA